MTVTSGGVPETYAYNADGARVMRQRGTNYQYYLDGLFERDGANLRWYYRFNNVLIGQRTGTAAAIYLHGDHLGSVSLTTDVSGVASTPQQFDPWGTIRSGTLTATTKRNYTGQILDDTGLLFYNARYYDPVLGRFISADTIVPGANPLTVAPSDGTASAAWMPGGSGPANPQELNRYSYAGNNPVRNTDPTGHCIFVVADTIACAAVAIEAIVYALGLGAAAYLTIDGLKQTSQVLSAEVSDASGSNTQDEVDGPYGNLEDPASVGPNKDYTSTQKKKILDQNRANNNGQLTDDYTGDPLEESTKSRSGVSPSPNEAQVDHYYPKARGGTNSYKNARVTSRQNNRAKADSLPEDWEPPSGRGPRY